MFGTAGISNMQSKRDEFNFNIKTYYNAQKCNDTNHCIFDEEECNLSKGYCDCIKHYYRNSYNNLCELCPKLEERCDDADCCSSSQYICIDGYCQCDHPACGTGVFVTASQVALSAALIMGIAALAMVVYRLCTRPKYLSARQRAALARSQGAQSSDNISGNDIRASLSSMQIRVINRLRDRPPAYDGSNNNGTCDRSTNTIGATTVSASVITRNHISTPLLIQQQNIDTPPPYINSENTPELELHRPPPYTEIILCPAGYLNESYINTEDTTLNNNENSTSFNNYNNNNNNNNNNSNNNSNNNNNNNNNTVDICPNITINISDNVTTISKERNNKDDVLNNKNDTKVKEDNDNNKNNKVDEKDSNNNENNAR